MKRTALLYLNVCKILQYCSAYSALVSGKAFASSKYVFKICCKVNDGLRKLILDIFYYYLHLDMLSPAMETSNITPSVYSVHALTLLSEVNVSLEIMNIVL